MSYWSNLPALPYKMAVWFSASQPRSSLPTRVTGRVCFICLRVLTRSQMFTLIPWHCPLKYYSWWGTLVPSTLAIISSKTTIDQLVLELEPRVISVASILGSSLPCFTEQSWSLLIDQVHWHLLGSSGPLYFYCLHAPLSRCQKLMPTVRPSFAGIEGMNQANRVDPTVLDRMNLLCVHKQPKLVLIWRGCAKWNFMNPIVWTKGA